MTQKLAALRIELEGATRSARAKGILILASAGNDYFPGATIEETQHPTAGIPGIVSVGAVDIGDPGTRDDDRVADFSSPGADLCGPGVGWPVGLPRQLPGQHPGQGSQPLMPTDMNGTSFSSPYIASVVALMIHEDPKLTPQEIEAILLDPVVVSHVPSKGLPRDGAGYVDAVAAVALAHVSHLRRKR